MIVKSSKVDVNLHINVEKVIPTIFLSAFQLRNVPQTQVLIGNMWSGDHLLFARAVTEPIHVCF